MITLGAIFASTFPCRNIFPDRFESVYVEFCCALSTVEVEFIFIYQRSRLSQMGERELVIALSSRAMPSTPLKPVVVASILPGSQKKKHTKTR